MILSLHIPKTAGVTIRNVLKQHFGPGFVLWYWKITDAWGRECPRVPRDAKCVHGHYCADRLTDEFPEARLMTWVRDPVERLVSSYYHRLREPDWQHPVCHELHRRRLSLEEYAELPGVRNEMSAFMGCTRPRDYFFIGIVEDFENSFARMGVQLGLKATSVRRDNVNPERTGPGYPLDPALRRRLAELNAEDVAIYEECVARAARDQALLQSMPV